MFQKCEESTTFLPLFFCSPPEKHRFLFSLGNILFHKSSHPVSSMTWQKGMTSTWQPDFCQLEQLHVAARIPKLYSFMLISSDKEARTGEALKCLEDTLGPVLNWNSTEDLPASTWKHPLVGCNMKQLFKKTHTQGNKSEDFKIISSLQWWF